MKIGDAVVFVDELRQDHPALVTAIHGSESDPNPGINLLWVSKDPNKHDTYGRQIERFSSCVHVSVNSARANCYKHVGE